MKNACLLKLRILNGFKLKKLEWAGVVELELEGVKDLPFHLEDFVLRVGFVANVNKLLDVWRVDFLVFGSDEER